MSLEDAFRREVEEEKKYAEKLKETAERARNLVVKVLLEAVSLDSIKHSRIYEALAELIAHPSLVSEGEAEDVRERIREHIEEERRALEELEKLLDSEELRENPAAKFLVEVLLRDEKLHHAMMEKIYEAIVEPRVLSEEDVWEMVWREAMWHGAPGG